MLQGSWDVKSGSWPRLVYYLTLEYIYTYIYKYSEKKLCEVSLVILMLLAWFLTPGECPGAPAVLMATGSLHWEQHRQLETIVSDSCLSARTKPRCWAVVQESRLPLYGSTAMADG